MLRTIQSLSVVLLLISVTNARVALKLNENEILSEIIRLNDTKADGCQIDINKDLNEPQPLVIVPGTDRFLLPDDERGIIFLEKGAQIELYCSKSFHGMTNVQFRNITCENGNFVENGQLFQYRDFNCTEYPFHVAVRTGKKCFNDASVLDVGFEVGYRFLKVYEICFDEVLETTHYVTHEFTPPYKTHQAGFPRPGWLNTGYYNGKRVDTLYTRASQREVVTKILNSTTQVDKYIPETSDFYLARGHISAKSDFIFGSQHRATFWLMNAAPQWQVFNNGNWIAVEIAIKNFVADRNIEVDAYTGTHGVTTLWDEQNKPHEIYLAFDENNNGLIPVPKIYYKILVERKTKFGIVLIGVNNPYLDLKEIESDYVLCKDVSDQINWVSWDKKNITLGYSYACDVNEFMAVIKHIPDLIVKGLLV
uniref:CSON012545 protein n=1 Tax=Culicoides sonorensis TaxID=179676 RepID=A0A336LKP8_CULSO